MAIYNITVRHIYAGSDETITFQLSAKTADIARQKAADYVKANTRFQLRYSSITAKKMEFKRR